MQQPKGTPPVVANPLTPAIPVMEYERRAPGMWTMHDIAFLAVRILALWTFIGALGSVSSLVPQLFMLRSGVEITFTLLASVVILIVMGIPVVMWIWSRPLARLILSPGAREGEPTPPHGRSDLLAGAFAIVGVYFVLLSIPPLAWMAFSILTERGDWRYGIQAIVSTVLGIALFFGSHGLTRFWQRLRSPNPLRSPQQEDTPPDAGNSASS